jgi:hypothetical protein
MKARSQVWGRDRGSVGLHFQANWSVTANLFRQRRDCKISFGDNSTLLRKHINHNFPAATKVRAEW